MRTNANLGLLLPLLMFLSAGSANAGSLFCCIDDSNKQVCGDILPQACYGRAYRELGESGRTLRRVDAPLTAEQRALRVSEERRRKEEEVVLKEQRRKDQALLDTYASAQDIEILRNRAGQEVRLSIKRAEEKIVGAREQRKKFEEEAEFYKKKQLPSEIEKGLRDVDSEIKALESVIEAKNKELETIRLKYDEDRNRYLELSRRPPPLPR